MMIQNITMSSLRDYIEKEHCNTNRKGDAVERI